jgi:hypothetical protein
MALRYGPSDGRIGCWLFGSPSFIQPLSRQREISRSPGSANKKECKVIEITIKCRNSNNFDEMIDLWMTSIDS